MTVKKKKIGAAGRFGAGYGKIKERLVEVEKIQRKKQECPFLKAQQNDRQAESGNAINARKYLQGMLITYRFKNLF